MKAQTIAPALELTSAIPANNLTASLITDRDNTISLYKLYCAASPNCDKKCKADQNYKCTQEQHSCFGVKAVYTIGCVFAGAAAGPAGGLIGDTLCGAFGGNSCRKKKKACLGDTNWFYTCTQACKKNTDSKNQKKPPSKDGGGGDDL